MRFCLISAGIGLAVAATLGAAGPAPLGHRATLVVRADPRSGRLVRAAVISPQMVRAAAVQPRVVAPVEISASAPRASGGDFAQFVAETARRYEVNPLLVHSVIEVESNYSPSAISRKGARGVMQLMPGTARRFQVADSFNPWQNVEGGVRYLKYLLTLFDSERLAVAAYNAGEGAVFRYGNVPPYPETTNYVRQVAVKYGAAREAARKTGLERAKAASSPAHPPIRQFTDAQGRRHYETRSGP
jgi:soluble lytic murein transglycosylase-like protein